MDIKILDSWIREYLETPATPEEIARSLSLTSQSVERITKIDHETLYEIEVTSNRPDAFSVYGLARELAAILPRFGFSAKLLPIPGIRKEIPKVKSGLPLEVKITQSSLVPRFTALIFDQVKIKPSPVEVQKRLEAAGIRSLNNVIDISNYLMLELGQPMHTFDYDKILGAKMTVRQAKKGEKLVTLDGVERQLPPGAIVIEDGERRLIDLCGIMGGKNSEVDEKTQRVLLFIQTYDPLSIRRACQELAFRTEAASRFEKGVDPEGVMIAMKRAVDLFADWAGAKVASDLFDIYPQPPQERKITLEKTRLSRLMGVEISLKEAQKILQSLGFETTVGQESLTAKVPHWRLGDIALPEDLIEEIARLYGYFNLPNILPPISFPQPAEPVLTLESRLKTALKFWGFTETLTYSMTSAAVLEKAGEEKEKLLKIANPLSEDLVYLRTSLLPSLLEVLTKNNNYPEIKIFEISHVYWPRGINELPKEEPQLAGLITPGDYRQAKGLVEAIMTELRIENVSFSFSQASKKIFDSKHSAELWKGKEKIGKVGEINPVVLKSFGLDRPVAFFELEIKKLALLATEIKKYQPISRYPPIIEDLALVVPPKTTIAEIENEIALASPLIKRVELIDLYQQTRTFRITYQSQTGNLTDKEVRQIREKIIENLAQKSIKLKGQ